MGELFRRIRYLINRRRFDAELESDMEFHREMAARAGRSNFGNTLRLREQAREAWGWTWLDRLIQDLRYAVRILARSPGFTLTAVLTLALGIGANTAIYSIIHGTLRLPYPHSERMVGIQNVFPQGNYYAASYPDFLDWRAHATSFSQLVAVAPSRATWNGESFGKAEPAAVGAWLASEGMRLVWR